MSSTALHVERNLEQFPDLHPAFDSQAALAEANRCLFCFDAPCMARMPHAHRRAALHQEDRERQPARLGDDHSGCQYSGPELLPGLPRGVLCEGACVMHRYNKQPIEIGRLQRFAMDAFYAKGAHLPPVAQTGTAPHRLRGRRSGIAELRRGVAAARGCGDRVRRPAAAGRPQHLRRGRVQTAPRG